MQEEVKLDARGNKILQFLKKQWLFFALIVIILFFSIVTDSFFSVANFIQIAQASSIAGIAACAITFVAIAGNMDMSLGANITLSVLMVIDIHDKLGPLAAIVIALACCLLVGLANGFIVGFLKVNSLIATLGMMSIVSGVMLLYTGGTIAWVENPKTTWLTFFGRETVGPIPMQVIILAVMVVIFQFVLTKTSFGRKIMAVGGNASASRYSGISDKKVVLVTYLLSGLMAWLAGLVMASRTMKYQTGIGLGYEFEVLTAVILGGTTLHGSGSVIRSLIAVIILISLQNGFIMLGLPYYFQWIVQCFVILIVVGLDSASKRKGAAA